MLSAREDILRTAEYLARGHDARAGAGAAAGARDPRLQAVALLRALRGASLEVADAVARWRAQRSLTPPRALLERWARPHGDDDGEQPGDEAGEGGGGGGPRPLTLAELDALGPPLVVGGVNYLAKMANDLHPALSAVCGLPPGALEFNPFMSPGGLRARTGRGGARVLSLYAPAAAAAVNQFRVSYPAEAAAAAAAAARGGGSPRSRSASPGPARPATRAGGGRVAAAEALILLEVLRELSLSAHGVAAPGPRGGGGLPALRRTASPPAGSAGGRRARTTSVGDGPPAPQPPPRTAATSSGRRTGRRVIDKPAPRRAVLLYPSGSGAVPSGAPPRVVLPDDPAAAPGAGAPVHLSARGIARLGACLDAAPEPVAHVAALAVAAAAGTSLPPPATAAAEMCAEGGARLMAALAGLDAAALPRRTVALCGRLATDASVRPGALARGSATAAALSAWLLGALHAAPHYLDWLSEALGARVVLAGAAAESDDAPAAAAGGGGTGPRRGGPRDGEGDRDGGAPGVSVEASRGRAAPRRGRPARGQQQQKPPPPQQQPQPQQPARTTPGARMTKPPQRRPERPPARRAAPPTAAAAAARTPAQAPPPRSASRAAAARPRSRRGSGGGPQAAYAGGGRRDSGGDSDSNASGAAEQVVAGMTRSLAAPGGGGDARPEQSPPRSESDADLYASDGDFYDSSDDGAGAHAAAAAGAGPRVTGRGGDGGTGSGGGHETDAAARAKEEADAARAREAATEAARAKKEADAAAAATRIQAVARGRASRHTVGSKRRPLAPGSATDGGATATAAPPGARTDAEPDSDRAARRIQAVQRGRAVRQDVRVEATVPPLARAAGASRGKARQLAQRGMKIGDAYYEVVLYEGATTGAARVVAFDAESGLTLRATCALDVDPRDGGAVAEFAGRVFRALTVDRTTAPPSLVCGHNAAPR